MTTNHRPTLEAKRGKSQSIRDTIAHARALPQQTLLKYRTDINVDDGKRAVQELKQELSGTKRISPDTPAPSKKRKEAESITALGEAKPLDIGTRESRAPKQEAEAEAEAEESSEAAQSQSGLESETDSDSEDEDDTAALLRELQNIRQEREAKKKVDEAQSKKESMLTSNPLLNVASQPNTGGVKKSWRSSSAFNSKTSNLGKTTKDEDESYTNNSLKSDTHKKFMSKYVR